MWTHYGLFFGEDAAQRVADHGSACRLWRRWRTNAAKTTTPLEQALVAGTRHRFLGDADSGTQAAALVAEGALLPTARSFVARCEQIVATAQVIEMVRELLPDGWQADFEKQVNALNAPADDLLADIWQATAQIAAAVVLEDETLFTMSIDRLQQVIRSEIHPEGYLPALVQDSAGSALERQVRAAQGLTLAAEIAAHAGTGENLWDYEVRGISVKTAAIYAAAYYEYRDSWQWDDPPLPDDNERFYQQHAAFLEMLNRQLRPVILKDTLEKLRPLMSVGGGFATLSHGIPQQPWWRFGF